MVPAKTLLNTSEPAVRSSRNSSHIMFVQRDCPPSENGAMPAALNFGTRAMTSSHVVGSATPTCLKIALFVKSTIGETVSHGIA